MSLKRQTIHLFSTGFFLFFCAFAYCQPNDTVFTKSIIPSDPYFEKLITDGEVTYLSKKTNSVISESTYIFLCGSNLVSALQEEHPLLTNFSYAHWDTLKVNPFRDVELPTPFKLAFDQSTFTHPVDGDIRITSRFGVRRRGYHRGLDIDLITGDSVRTILPGKVRFVGYSRGHGKTVLVRHANEVETLYAHLSGYNVKINDVVEEGQVIGLGGNTGRSYGSHLHLEIRYKGRCVHPEYVLNMDGSQKLQSTELWVNKSWSSPRDHSAYRKSDLKPLLTAEAAIAAQNALPKYYRVRKGDTLSHIASRYNMRIREICSLNAISTSSILRIGQLLKIR